MQATFHLIGEVLRHAWAVLGEMAPWVLGGFAVAGALSPWLNARTVRAHFGGGRVGAIAKAVALGIPLPVCSCGVIPLGASLRKHGAGKGATAAFVTSTPQTGVDSIAVTYGMMGGLFALLRPLAALVSGVACGFAVDALDGDAPAAAARPEPESESDARPRWVRALHNGFVVLPRSVGGALLAGALISAAVMTLVPPNLVAETISSPLLQMVLTLAIGIPTYICSTAAVPFSLGLLAAGLSPGAVMTFLVAGPGVSASTVLAVGKLLGARATVVYVLVLSACALGFGLLAQALVPAGWVPPGARLVDLHAHCAEGLPWNVHVQAFVLLALLAWAKWGPRMRPGAA
ncbi:MAG TPA: permease [Kiritimatiellia bacterium]|nr:permease [Kiritimatiellia bacterium]